VSDRIEIDAPMLAAIVEVVSERVTEHVLEILETTWPACPNCGAPIVAPIADPSQTCARCGVAVVIVCGIAHVGTELPRDDELTAELNRIHEERDRR
jgi:hypothetical protein